MIVGKEPVVPARATRGAYFPLEIPVSSDLNEGLAAGGGDKVLLEGKDRADKMASASACSVSGAGELGKK